MALIHEFENTGNWLFRRRGWLPVFLAFAGVIMLYLVNRQSILFDRRDELVFLGVSIFGELIRILTIGFTPRNTSGRNVNGQLADELNMTGMYSLIRHPLYLGNFFMWLGPVLFLRSLWVDIVFCLIYWLYYERIMFAEEQFLRKKFGEVYDRYSERVAAFIPHSFHYESPDLRFSIRNILKREYNSIFNIFLMFTVLDIFRNYFLSRKIYVTGMWLYMFAGAAAFWIIIRLIHKKTKLLQVEGR